MDYQHLTKEQILALAQPDPEFTELVKTQTMPQYDFSDPYKLILNMREGMKRWNTGPIPGVAEKDIMAPTRDGVEIRLRVFTSESPAPAEGRPLFVLYHGGGFTIGSPESLAPISRALAQKFSAVVVCPSYRLAPENPFPVGVNDSWDAFKWIGIHAAELEANPNAGFIVGGVSAGGKVAVVVSHLAQDESFSPKITGVWSAAGSVAFPESIPEKYKPIFLSATQEECTNAAITSDRLSKLFNDSAKQDKSSPLASPLIWPSGHSGQPKTFFQVCGMDIVRDHGLVYEKILREEVGVETRLNVYPGWPHIFFQVLPTAKRTKEFYADAMTGVAWLLGKQ